MRNAGLEEAQAGIKISRRNINNLRYADDATLMAESEEELKSLLMKVKVESEKIEKLISFIYINVCHGFAYVLKYLGNLSFYSSCWAHHKVLEAPWIDINTFIIRSIASEGWVPEFPLSLSGQSDKSSLLG